MPSCDGLQLLHALEEGELRAADVPDRLTGHGLGQESDEIAGVTRVQDGPDLAVRLEASNPRAMSGAGVDDDERTLVIVDLDAVGGQDPNETVIDRPLQFMPVHDQLKIVVKHVLNRLRRVLEILVAALPHDVPEEDVALPTVGGVVQEGLPRQLRHGIVTISNAIAGCPLIL